MDRTWHRGLLFQSEDCCQVIYRSRGHASKRDGCLHAADSQPGPLNGGRQEPRLTLLRSHGTSLSKLNAPSSYNPETKV